MKQILYLVIYSSGREQKYYVENWLELIEFINRDIQIVGQLPDLIYRKE